MRHARGETKCNDCVIDATNNSLSNAGHVLLMRWHAWLTNNCKMTHPSPNHEEIGVAQSNTSWPNCSQSKGLSDGCREKVSAGRCCWNYSTNRSQTIDHWLRLQKVILLVFWSMSNYLSISIHLYVTDVASTATSFILFDCCFFTWWKITKLPIQLPVLPQ